MQRSLKSVITVGLVAVAAISATVVTAAVRVSDRVGSDLGSAMAPQAPRFLDTVQVDRRVSYRGGAKQVLTIWDYRNHDLASRCNQLILSTGSGSDPMLGANEVVDGIPLLDTVQIDRRVSYADGVKQVLTIFDYRNHDLASRCNDLIQVQAQRSGDEARASTP